MEYKKTLKKILNKGIYTPISNLVKGAYLGTKLIHTAPSFFVKNEKLMSDSKQSMIKDVSYILTLVFWLRNYAVLAEVESHPEVLLIPVATNALSGLYEIVRYAKKKGLESKVGE